MINVNYRLRTWLAAGLLLALPGDIVGSRAFSARAAEGAQVFKAKCAMCHGSDASGNTPMGQRMKIRDLRSPAVQKQTDEELTAIITNGKPPMPAYGKSLTPGDIHDIVAYLRSIATKS